VQEWNQVFLLVCAAWLFVDPLFFYALSISGDSCMIHSLGFVLRQLLYVAASWKMNTILCLLNFLFFLDCYEDMKIED